MPLLQNGIGWKLSLGVLLGGVYALSIVGPGCYLPHVVQTAVVSLAVWLLVLGVLGGFLRYAGHPSPIARYLSDASYWVYLIHLPLTLFLPGLLIDVPLPSLAKFMIVCSTTLAICLCTYHYLVRATKIGQLLNGKRYPRSLPKAS